MNSLNYIIWNVAPEIFEKGSFALRWYGIFFVLGFIISQQILYYIYKKEGKPEKDVDTITIYMVIATIIGARMGHVLFYQPELILEDPLSIFLPFQFTPEFRFTGFQGLASHGGAIGILLALWLYTRYSFTRTKTTAAGEEKKGFFVRRRDLPGQSYFQVLDRIVILVALTGAFIRLGNFFNSEIIGKPTDLPIGVAFVSRLTEAVDERMEDTGNVVESVVYQKNDSVPALSNGRLPLSAYYFFKPGTTELEGRHIMNYARDVAYRLDLFFDPGHEFAYEIAQQKDGNLAARLSVVAILRHPAQLYESFSCIVLFLVLYFIWTKYKQDLPAGRLFGIFLIVCFGLRFFYEFLKENQEVFENDLPINMGQILSIPLVLAGIFVLIYSYRKQTAVITESKQGQPLPDLKKEH